MYLKKQELSTPGFVHPSSLAVLQSFFKLNKNSHLIDLGSGTGEVIFSLSRLCDCKSTGIEAIPSLHQIAQKINHSLKEPVQLYCENFENRSLKNYTHIFLAWTTWPESTQKKLIEALKKLTKGTYIITTSVAIIDKKFDYHESKIAIFSWGIGTLHFHRVR